MEGGAPGPCVAAPPPSPPRRTIATTQSNSAKSPAVSGRDRDVSSILRRAAAAFMRGSAPSPTWWLKPPALNQSPEPPPVPHESTVMVRPRDSAAARKTA